jgi:hypothetical protein
MPTCLAPAIQGASADGGLLGVPGSCDRRLVRYPGMGRARAKASPRQVDLMHSLGGCLDRMNTLLLSKIFYRFGSVFSAWLWRSKFRRSAVFDIPCSS